MAITNVFQQSSRLPEINGLPGGFSRRTTIQHSKADRIQCNLAAAARALLNEAWLKRLSREGCPHGTYDLRGGGYKR